MTLDQRILENQAFCLKRTYEEYQLIAQRHRVEYERTMRRLREISEPAPASFIVEPECVE